MACSTCLQARCVCAESDAALGLPVDVVQPEGDELNASELASLLPCDSTSCSSTPADPNVCCNYFNANEAGSGDAFFYSAGGPFALPALQSCTSCPPPAALVALPDAPSGAFQSPGALQDVICLDLPPGTYRVDARMTIVNSVPGTRVLVLYRPDCTIDLEYTALDCTEPCGCCGSGDITPVQKFHCSGFLVVENDTCNPGIRLLVQSGCNMDVYTLRASLENLQLIVTPLTQRDILECNTSALNPGT